MGISVDENLYELLQSDIPVVLLDLNLTGPNATYITSDNLSSQTGSELFKGIGP